MTLNKLPVEILLEIGENAGIKSLVSLSAVNRRIHSILASCILKRTTAFQRLPSHVLLAIGSECGMEALESLVAVNRRCYSVLVSSLYSRGAVIIANDPEMKEAYYHPVASAMRDGEYRTVSLFLANGFPADTWVNCYEEGNEFTDTGDYSLLHLSRDCDDTKFMRLLLQYGADPNKPHEDEGSALHWVLDLAYPHTRMEKYVKLLLDYGADVNIRGPFGHTPLHTAAQHNDTTVIPLLIAYGAKLNAVDKYNCTPMNNAKGWGSLEAVKILQNYGAHDEVVSED
ncbi:ankyrin repeat-containing domain protein [Pyronema omphalodes]|nr:ankyrin repeat-containing domain protein [Pyronema omphalodes]